MKSINRLVLNKIACMLFLLKLQINISEYVTCKFIFGLSLIIIVRCAQSHQLIAFLCMRYLFRMGVS
jgi:hypothetical protein